MLVENFYLISGPVRFSEKFQARFNRWVFAEAIDLDAEGEIVPAVFLNQVIEHSFQSDAVQGVVAHEGLLVVMLSK